MSAVTAEVGALPGQAVAVRLRAVGPDEEPSALVAGGDAWPITPWAVLGGIGLLCLALSTVLLVRLSRRPKAE